MILSPKTDIEAFLRTNEETLKNHFGLVRKAQLKSKSLSLENLAKVIEHEWMKLSAVQRCNMARVLTAQAKSGTFRDKAFEWAVSVAELPEQGLQNELH